MDELQSWPSWYLQGSVDGVAMPKRIELATFPMRIGREMGIELVLPVAQVSTLHAEISERAGGLWVRDLGSTNGTWLNGSPVKEPRPIEVGDRLRFANLEFLLEHPCGDFNECENSIGLHQSATG